MSRATRSNARARRLSSRRRDRARRPLLMRLRGLHQPRFARTGAGIASTFGSRPQRPVLGQK